MATRWADVALRDGSRARCCARSGRSTRRRDPHRDTPQRRRCRAGLPRTVPCCSHRVPHREPDGCHGRGDRESPGASACSAASSIPPSTVSARLVLGVIALMYANKADVDLLLGRCVLRSGGLQLLVSHTRAKAEASASSARVAWPRVWRSVVVLSAGFLLATWWEVSLEVAVDVLAVTAALTVSTRHPRTQGAARRTQTPS